MTTWILIGFLMANILMTAFRLMSEFGLFENRKIQDQCAYLIMNINLLFKKKIIVKPHIEYYSEYQGSEHFYLIKTFKCSHERFFKIISGSYTTIVPEHGIYEIDGEPIKTKA